MIILFLYLLFAQVNKFFNLFVSYTCGFELLFYFAGKQSEK